MNNRNLTTEEFMLLLRIVDRERIDATTVVKDKYIVDLPEFEAISNAGLVEVRDNVVYPTKQGNVLVRLSKSMFNYGQLVKSLNFKALTRLLDLLLKHCANSGFHINVLIKNLDEDTFNYLEEEFSEGVIKRNHPQQQPNE